MAVIYCHVRKNALARSVNRKQQLDFDQALVTFSISTSTRQGAQHCAAYSPGHVMCVLARM